MRYELNQVYNTDCLEAMKQIPDKFFELAIVDPPYGIGESSKNHSSRNTPIKQKNGTILKAKDKGYTRKEWDNMPPSQEYFNELFRVSQKQIIWGENYFDFNQKKTSPGRIIWDKVNGQSDFSDCEIAWTNCITSTRQIEYMWAGMMQGKSLEEGRLQQGNKALNQKRIHATEKPILLYKWLIHNYAKPGDKILDTHLGSGSHRIAAHDMGFDFLGLELDLEHYTKAEQRYQQHIQQLTLFAA